MPFKIVQTKDKEVTELSAVPSDWEARGKLFWPQKNVKNRARLIKDDRSKPSPEWDIIHCTVKRSNIMTYKEAEDEINIMQEHTDTDIDINDNPPSRAVHATEQSVEEEINFGDVAVMMLQNKESLPVESEAPLAGGMSDNVVLIRQPTIESEMIQLCTTDNFAQILANQAVILEKINNLSVIVKTIVTNQNKLALKLAALSVQVDNNHAKLLEKSEEPVNVTLLKEATAEERQSFSFREIDNLKQLEDFELLLLDWPQKNKLKSTLSILCSVSQGSGITCAYKLLDVLLSREFLCKCSWSGGSRGEHSKIAIKDHKLFIKFFFEMIFSWDTSFTMEQLEKFFKIVLKNALKRKSMKNLRASSKRIRKTKPITNVADNAPGPSQVNQSNPSLNENHDQSIMEIRENIIEDVNDSDLLVVVK